MDFEKYLLFVGASIVLCIVPGPDMILLLSRSITQGRRAGLMTAFGINLGAYFHLFAAIAGISAIIATSAYAFTAIKWAGATYLLYLGITVLRSKSRPLQIDAESIKIIAHLLKALAPPMEHAGADAQLLGDFVDGL